MIAVSGVFFGHGLFFAECGKERIHMRKKQATMALILVLTLAAGESRTMIAVSGVFFGHGLFFAECGKERIHMRKKQATMALILVLTLAAGCAPGYVREYAQKAQHAGEAMFEGKTEEVCAGVCQRICAEGSACRRSDV